MESAEANLLAFFEAAEGQEKALWAIAVLAARILQSQRRLVEEVEWLRGSVDKLRRDL